ncbi:MAG TPA: hypothetical protein VM364_14170 [Vicinamibacterales bacterium]|nr:hypothetical protein [Vicinamibacterales bacterium]
MRRRWLRVLLLAVVAAVALGLGAYAARRTLLTWVGHQLVAVDPLEPSDAILVLAGGTPGREIEGADLYLAGYAPLVVITREPDYSGVELLKARSIRVASHMEERLRYLRELGVPEASTVVLRGARRIDAPRGAAGSRVGAASWGEITDRRHLGLPHRPRRMIFRREFGGSGIRLALRAAAADRFRPDTWWQNRVTLRNGLIEWQKQVLYRFNLP